MPEHFSNYYPNILVNIKTQELIFHKKEDEKYTFNVSTSCYGVGNLKDSFKTPAGKHLIYKKIGEGEPIGRRFIARKPTNEIIKPNIESNEDYILTRILWLKGIEEGVNKSGDVDTLSRYIYIHGTHEEKNLGKPASHGCIRMSNADIIWLYDKVKVGALVTIDE